MNIIWLGNLTTFTFHSTFEKKKKKHVYLWPSWQKSLKKVIHTVPDILICDQLISEAILLYQLVFSAHYLCNGVITVLNTKRFYCKESFEYFLSVLTSRRQFQLSICLSVLDNEGVKGFFLSFCQIQLG